MSGRFLLAPLATALLAGFVTAMAAENAPAPAMDARVARCVRENVALARSKAGAELVAEACEALIHQADSDPAHSASA